MWSPNARGPPLMLGTAPALLGLLALAAPAAGTTEPIAIQVEFDAPAGCSDIEAFYRAVLFRASRAHRADAKETAVRVKVRLWRAAPDRVDGELRMVDARGGVDTRKVSGASCDEVVAGLSLTAALALDSMDRAPPPPARGPAIGAATPASAPPRAVVAPAPPAAPPVPAAPSVPAVPARPPEPLPPAGVPVDSPPPAGPPPALPSQGAGAPAETARAGARPAPSRWGLALGAQALAATVVTPSTSLGGGLSLRLVDRARELAGQGGPSRALGASFLYLPDRLLRPGDGVILSWKAVALTACPGWGWASAILAVQPCGQAIGGWLAVTGEGLTNPRSVGRSWWSLGALVRAALRLGAGFTLELEGGVALPLVERRFVTTTPEATVAETPTVSTMFGLALVRGL